jgi:hypothetical protein
MKISVEKMRKVVLKYRFLILIFIILFLNYFFDLGTIVDKIELNNKNLVQTQIQIQKINLNCSCKSSKDIVFIRKTDKFWFVYVRSNGKIKKYFKLSRKEFPLENITCDLFNVLRHGPNQKVLGYSLYGTNKGYYKEFKKIIKFIHKYYPDWSVRVYYDEQVDREFLCEMECLKSDKKNKIYYDRVNLCSISNLRFGLNEIKIWDASYIHAMKWRWLPLGIRNLNVNLKNLNFSNGQAIRLLIFSFQETLTLGSRNEKKIQLMFG